MNNEGENNKHQKDELTRRQWLLRLGETVVLMGFSGGADEVKAGAASLFGLAAAGLSTLPPGLYEPSNDHLSHALSSEALYHPLPPGSETEYVRLPSGPFEPQFFSPEEFPIVRRIVELMLGETPEPSSGTGGTKDRNRSVAAEVAEWVDHTAFNAAGVREAARRIAPEFRVLAVRYYGPKAVQQMETADSQKTCREGLEWLAGESNRRYGKAFLSLREPEQVQLLTLLSDQRSDKSTENPGTRFFQWMKDEVIRGFYTSQTGLKELDYKGNSFYVESPGCAADRHPKSTGDGGNGQKQKD